MLTVQRKKQLQERIKEYKAMLKEGSIDLPQLTEQFIRDKQELKGINVDPFRQ